MERSTVLGVRLVVVCDLQKVVKLGLVGLFNWVHRFSSSLYTATLKIVFQLLTLWIQNLLYYNFL